MSMQIGKGEAVSATRVSDAFPADPTLSAKSPVAGHSEPPEPLVRQTKPPAELPIAALGPLQKPVEAIATLTSAPVTIAMQSVLATTALATQPLRNVETLMGAAPLNLFLLTIAASGERKSSCDRLAMRAVQAFEEVRMVAYERACEGHAFELELHENLRRRVLKDRLGDTPVIEGNPPASPQQPIAPRKLLADITIEGLLRHFEDGDPSVGIFADEGGQFFGGHGMNRDNQLKTAAGLSKLWDGAAVNRTRAGTELATFRHRRVSLHLMVQPGIAEAVLASETLRDQGLLSRLLLAWPESRIGQRWIEKSEAYEQARDAAERDLTAFDQQITALLETAPQTHDSPLELAPPILELDPAAKDLLIDFANDLEKAQGPHDQLAHITGFASKAAEQAVRLAGILTVFSDQDAQAVSFPAMEQGVKLTTWFVSEAERLLDAGPASKIMIQAQLLLDWLHDTWGQHVIDKRTVVRKGPRQIRDTQLVEQLIQILVRHRHLEPLPFGGEIEEKHVGTAWGVYNYG